MAKWKLSLNSLKLSRNLFHFAFFEFIALLRFVWSTQKRQTGTYTVVKEKKSFEGTL